MGFPVTPTEGALSLCGSLSTSGGSFCSGGGGGGGDEDLDDS